MSTPRHLPGDELDEGVVELDAGAGVEDAGAVVGEEVVGHHLLVGVAEDALHRAVGRLLDLLLDLLHRGLLAQPDGEVHHRHVRGGHAEGHAGQLAVQVGDHLADGLGGAGGGGNDVLSGAAAVAPVLAAGAVHGLLGGGGGVHGGHQALYNGEVVVDHLGHRRQAVGGAGSVGHHLHVGLVGVQVHATDEHGRVSGRGGDDHLLGAALEVSARLLDGGEHAGRLDDVLSARLRPRDVVGLHLVEDGDLLACGRNERRSSMSRLQRSCVLCLD